MFLSSELQAAQIVSGGGGGARQHDQGPVHRELRAICETLNLPEPSGRDAAGLFSHVQHQVGQNASPGSRPVDMTRIPEPRLHIGSTSGLTGRCRAASCSHARYRVFEADVGNRPRDFPGVSDALQRFSCPSPGLVVNVMSACRWRKSSKVFQTASLETRRSGGLWAATNG